MDPSQLSYLYYWNYKGSYGMSVLAHHVTYDQPGARVFIMVRRLM